VTYWDALRDHLELTGAKRICDRGTCGACTVILDRQGVYACCVLAVDAQGKPDTDMRASRRGPRTSADSSVVEQRQQHVRLASTPGFGHASASKFLTKRLPINLRKVRWGHGREPLPLRHLCGNPQGRGEAGRPDERRFSWLTIAGAMARW